MKLRKLIAVLLALSLLLCAIPAAIAAEETVPMYRLYNPNSGEHFYTGSEAERDHLSAAGWQYEGIAWHAPVQGGDPIYRVFNPNSGDHHYSGSWDEVQTLVCLGWQYEDVAFNSAPNTGAPQYRLYNPNADLGSHHYTGSIEERDTLVAAGWRYEGIGWYGVVQEPTQHKLKITSRSPKIFIGETFQLAYTYTGNSNDLTWWSTDESVVTVEENGMVTGVNAGDAIIKVTDGELTAKVGVEVIVKTTDIKIFSEDAPLYDGVTKFAGDYLKFRTIPLPEETEDKVTVTTSDSSVVSVSYEFISWNKDTNVTLNFLKAGTAVITLTSEDGAVTETCTIHVKDDYDCAPAEQDVPLDPNVWADYCTQVMVENGFRKNTRIGSYRLATKRPSDLTFANARRAGESLVHSWWSNGCRSCWISYEGTNEDGNYIFYYRWG